MLVKPHRSLDFRLCTLIFLMLFLCFTTAGSSGAGGILSSCLFFFNFPLLFHFFSVSTFLSSYKTDVNIFTLITNLPSLFFPSFFFFLFVTSERAPQCEFSCHSFVLYFFLSRPSVHHPVCSFSTGRLQMQSPLVPFSRGPILTSCF